MRDPLRRQFTVEGNILAVCEEYKPVFAANALAQQMIAQLAASRGRAQDGLNMLQEAGEAFRAATETRVAARALLSAGVKTVVDTSPVVALDAKIPVPFHKSASRSDLDLIDRATDIAKRGLPLADRFAPHGVPRTTFTEMPGRIADLQKAIADCDAARRLQKAGRAMVKKALPDGAGPIRTLQRIFFNAKKGDESALAKWRKARFVGPSRAGASTQETPTPPSTTKVA